MTAARTSAQNAAMEALLEAHATELKLPTVKARFRAMATEATRALQASSTTNNNRREVGPLQASTVGPLQVATLTRRSIGASVVRRAGTAARLTSSTASSWRSRARTSTPPTARG